MGCGSESSSSCSKSSSRSAAPACGGGCPAPAPAPAPSCGGGCPADPPASSECCKPIPAGEPQEAAPAGAAFKSRLAKKILCAKCPVDVSETATTCANGVKGIYVNKSEVDSFNGPIPIEDYEIFNDPNPKIVNKVMTSGGAQQQVTVKFLQAPGGGPAGEIVIRERAAPAVCGAPPVIIRQPGTAGCAGKPQCFRECPPPPPPKICPKLIEICAKPDLPQRRVIIEKMPSTAGTPGPIYAERWIPGGASCRNVVYEPAPKCAPKAPRNVIINWSAPAGGVQVQTDVQGPEPANPCQYKKQHGNKLVPTSKLPEVVRNIQAPGGANGVPRLTGCVAALKLVDLNEHDLSEYADQVSSA